MNLTNALETNPYAFSLVCLGLFIIMLALFAGFTITKTDTSSAQRFTLLKNFFSYVDHLENNVFNKDIEKVEFKDTVEKITGLKISYKESENLFKMVHVNRNMVVGMNRSSSFFCGPSPMVNLGGSGLSIFCENYAVKPVFSVGTESHMTEGLGQKMLRIYKRKKG